MAARARLVHLLTMFALTALRKATPLTRRALVYPAQTHAVPVRLSLSHAHQLQTVSVYRVAKALTSPLVPPAILAQTALMPVTWVSNYSVDLTAQSLA